LGKMRAGESWKWQGISKDIKTEGHAVRGKNKNWMGEKQGQYEREKGKINTGEWIRGTRKGVIHVLGVRPTHEAGKILKTKKESHPEGSRRKKEVKKVFEKLGKKGKRIRW